MEGVRKCKEECEVIIRTVNESAVAVHTYSVSKRVGMASIFGLRKRVNNGKYDMYKKASYMNRTVEEPNRSVRAPTFSSPRMIFGRRPFQVTLATTSPAEFVIIVCLNSALRSHCGSGSGCFGEDDMLDTDLDDDATGEGGRTTEQIFCSSGTSAGGNNTVVISYARSPVATSRRDVLSMSGAVNLNSIVKSCEWVNERANQHVLISQCD